MVDQIPLDREFFSLLEQEDARIAEQVAAAGCPECGGPLHRSDYERKPRGGQTGYDTVIPALSGLMAMTGTAEVAPLKVGAPVIDYATGTTGAFRVRVVARGSTVRYRAVARYEGLRVRSRVVRVNVSG